MYLPGLCNCDVSRRQLRNEASPFVIVGLTGNDGPGILAMRMHVSSYFLARVSVPNDNRCIFSFQNDRPNWFAIGRANIIPN